MDPQPGRARDWAEETPALCSLVVDMLRHTRAAFQVQQREPLDAAERLGRTLHDREKTLTEQIVHQVAGATFVLEADKERMFVPLHLERAADHIELLRRAVGQAIREGTSFTDRARREIEAVIDDAIEMLVDVRDLLLTGNKVLRRHVIEAGRALVARADECAASHQQRLIEGVCAPLASSTYLSMLDAVKGIEWHAREIAQKLEHPTPADLREMGDAFGARAGAAPSEPAGGPDRPRRDREKPPPTPVGWVP